MKQADCIGAAANTGNQRARQLSRYGQDLFTRLASDYTLKLAHHQRIRMWAERATQQTIGIVHICYPVAHSFVDRVLQRTRAGMAAYHSSAHRPHPDNVS